MRGPTWTKKEEAIVRNNAGMMSFENIGKLIGRSALSVQLFMYRKKIPSRRQIARPIVTLMLRTKFGDETLFQPNKAFYARVEMSSRRFQTLAQGYAQPTQDEIIRISRALSMRPDEMLKLQDATQLELFEL